MRTAHHELTFLVPPDDPIKLIRLRIQNYSDRPRKLSATYYAEWVLGAARDETAMHIVTEIDPKPALFSRETPSGPISVPAWHSPTSTGDPRTLTADRAEFLGRHGSLAAPAALARVGLSGSTGETLDPCAAIQTAFELEPGAEIQIVFLLGEADGIDAARELVRRYCVEGQALQCSARRSGTVGCACSKQCRCVPPSPRSISWSIAGCSTRCLSCRVWGRSAFYQSGGALRFSRPAPGCDGTLSRGSPEARAHILRAAGRQFPEGDVQHWWHPPAGRGIRTRIADDPLWLPFVTARYVAATGDESILDETIPYLAGAAVRPDQNDDYGLPATSAESGSLYDHCVRALERAHRLGAHGLPLMDHGDWNDGMNRVGYKGKGESVWLAWFQITCLGEFSRISETRGEHSRAASWHQRADCLADGRREECLGRRHGIAAPISTMELR